MDFHGLSFRSLGTLLWCWASLGLVQWGAGAYIPELELSVIVVTSGSRALVLNWQSSSSDTTGRSLVQVTLYSEQNSRWPGKEVSSETTLYSQFLQRGRQGLRLSEGIVEGTWYVVCANLTIWRSQQEPSQMNFFTCLTCSTPSDEDSAATAFTGQEPEVAICPHKVPYTKQVTYDSGAEAWSVRVVPDLAGLPWEILRSGAYVQNTQVPPARPPLALQDGGSLTLFTEAALDQVGGTTGARWKLCTWAELRLSSQVEEWAGLELQNVTRCSWEGYGDKGAAAARRRRSAPLLETVLGTLALVISSLALL